jgi:hypothetical protein
MAFQIDEPSSRWRYKVVVDDYIGSKIYLLCFQSIQTRCQAHYKFNPHVGQRSFSAQIQNVLESKDSRLKFRAGGLPPTTL